MSKKPVVVSFKLFPGRDDDLIKFLKSIGSREKSSYIRLAIRNQFVTGTELSRAKFKLIPQPGIARLSEVIEVSESSEEDTLLSDEDIEKRLDCW